jgi:hypothetical protein
MDWGFPAFVLSAIVAVANVAQVAYLISQARKQKADVRAAANLGYFLELGKETTVYLRIVVDNVGMKGTSIKRIVATVPMKGGGVTLSEGHLPDDKPLPVNVGANKSEVLEVRFKFQTARLHFNVRDKNQMLPSMIASGFTGRSLFVRVVIEHTHDKAMIQYDTYSATAAETLLFGSLSQMSLNAELLRKSK